MKAAVWHGGKDIRIESLSEPKLVSNDVLIRVQAASICGSDLHAYEGVSKRRVPPLIMGHEVAGEIADIGTDVETLKKEDRVIVYPVLSCGYCERCRSGSEYLCRDFRLIGLHVPGGFAEYMTVPANKCYKVPTGLTPEKACLTEPLAVAVHTVNNLPTRVNDSVLVIGAGIIGSLITQVMRLRTSGQLIVTDVLDSRLNQAREFGADVAINSKEKEAVDEILKMTDGRGVDLSIEVVGIQSTVEQALASVKKGGVVAVVGLLERNMEIDMMRIVSNELKLHGSYCYNDYDFRSSIRLIADEKISLQPYLTHILDLVDATKGFEEMSVNKENVLKVILKP